MWAKFFPSSHALLAEPQIAENSTMAHSDDDATFYDILNDNDGNLIGIGGTQGDPRMESIDKLMEIGIGEYLSLPQV